MGIGIAILALFGVGLLITALDDDDTGADVSETDADQRLSTTDASETIETGSGNDVVRSQGGDDLVDLGAGNDRAFGGQGADALFGGTGNDLIRGEQDNDQIFGGSGADSLFGDGGNDILYGANIIDEDALFDQVDAAGFLLFDNTGLIDATADAGEGDTVAGGTGDDTIFAGSNDDVSTGSGADEVQLGDWITPGAAAEIVDFDPAEDALVYSIANGAPVPTVDIAVTNDNGVEIVVEGEVVATLPNLTENDAQDIQLTLVERPAANGIETFVGSEDGDVIRGTESSDFVLANDGNDRVFARAGTDAVSGGAGNDFLRGEAGDDTLFGDAGADTLNGDAGNDLLFGADLFGGVAPAELARGSGLLSTSDGPLTLRGLANVDGDPGDADTLTGGVGDDLIVAGAADVVDTGTGADTVNLGDWVNSNGPPVDIIDFDPAQDVVVYTYAGSTAPTVSFAEADDGTATVEIALSNTENQVVARFTDTSFDALIAGNALVIEPL